MLLLLARCPNAIRPLFHRSAIFTAVIPPPLHFASPPLPLPPKPPLFIQLPTFRFNEYPFTARRKGHAKLVSVINRLKLNWFQWKQPQPPKESRGPCGSGRLEVFFWNLRSKVYCSFHQKSPTHSLHLKRVFLLNRFPQSNKLVYSVQKSALSGNCCQYFSYCMFWIYFTWCQLC